MAVDRKREEHVTGRGKISETFVEFAEPILPEDLATAQQEEVENALKVAYTIWNAVVFEAARGDRRFLDQFHEQMATRPDLRPMAQQLVKRKYDHYGDDHRLIRGYEFRWKNGQPNVWAEAGDPYSLPSSDTP